jgi:negative regulator of sigma-B (phosphoserine phosphatase)
MGSIINSEREIANTQLLTWGVASVPVQGQTVSGDQRVVKIVPDGCLVAVIDGLGHGYAAAYASEKAVAILEEYGHESPIPLLRRCHNGLRETRGVTISLAKISSSDEIMTWLGVGNVEGVLIRADRSLQLSHESVITRGGVVGYQMPQLSASVTPISKGDLLIFATDGVENDFTEDIRIHDSPQRIADHICMRYNKNIDDALVLVARYNGVR